MRGSHVAGSGDGSAPGSLAVVRLGAFGIWFVHVAGTPIDRLAHLPELMFSPPGFLALLPDEFWSGFGTEAFLTVARIVLAGLLLAVIVHLARAATPSRMLLVTGALGVLLWQGYVQAWGSYLDHVRLGLLYVTIVLSLIPHDRREGLQLAGLMLAMTYSLIGLHRILVGGWEIFAGDALPTYMALRTIEPGTSSFDTGLWLVGSAPAIAAMKLGFACTTVAEILSPFAVFHRRLRLAWLAVMVPFHVVTLFTMNIFFWENLILIAFLFTDLPARLARRFRLRDEAPACHHTPTPRAAPAA